MTAAPGAVRLGMLTLAMVLAVSYATAAQTGSPSGASKAGAASGAGKAATSDAFAPADQAASATPQTAEELKSRLLAEVGGGKWKDSLPALFKDYAAAEARQKLVPGTVSEDFWKWLCANKEIRDALVVRLYPSFDAEVFKYLQTLKANCGTGVDTHPHLAVAFALVYGKAQGKALIDPGWGHMVQGRDQPSIEESFKYYLDNEKMMRLPLKAMPWPLLVHLADNDLPLNERQWVLTQYGATPPARFGKVYYDVRYNNKMVGNSGRKPNRTLAMILEEGGVCADRAYFASRVFKSLGVPALIDRGEGGRGGHAWVAWVGNQGKGLDLLDSGRFDYDRYYTGEVFDPLFRRTGLDREVQLDVGAMMYSYAEYLNALACCALYRMQEKEPQTKATFLLDAAAQRNCYCSETWRLVADAVGQGVIPRPVGEKMFDTMLKAFAGFPDLTFEVLQKILAPRFGADAKPRPEEVSKNLRILDQAFLLYEKSKRPDLAVKLRCLQGQYLEAVGRRSDALKLYVMASEKYVTEHFGFVDLFDRAVSIMQQDKQQDMMLKYMKAVANLVPEYPSQFQQQFKLPSDTFVHVVEAYAKALREAGRTAEAAGQEARLPKKK